MFQPRLQRWLLQVPIPAPNLFSIPQRRASCFQHRYMYIMSMLFPAQAPEGNRSGIPIARMAFRPFPCPNPFAGFQSPQFFIRIFNPFHLTSPHQCAPPVPSPSLFPHHRISLSPACQYNSHWAWMIKLLHLVPKLINCNGRCLTRSTATGARGGGDRAGVYALELFYADAPAMDNVYDAWAKENRAPVAGVSGRDYRGMVPSNAIASASAAAESAWIAAMGLHVSSRSRRILYRRTSDVAQ